MTRREKPRTLKNKSKDELVNERSNDPIRRLNNGKISNCSNGLKTIPLKKL
jgi:hypothetical protein